jgi:hypothetical protein
MTTESQLLHLTQKLNSIPPTDSVSLLPLLIQINSDNPMPQMKSIIQQNPAFLPQIILITETTSEIQVLSETLLILCKICSSSSVEIEDIDMVVNSGIITKVIQILQKSQTTTNNNNDTLFIGQCYGVLGNIARKDLPQNNNQAKLQYRSLLMERGVCDLAINQILQMNSTIFVQDLEFLITCLWVLRECTTNISVTSQNSVTIQKIIKIFCFFLYVIDNEVKNEVLTGLSKLSIIHNNSSLIAFNSIVSAENSITRLINILRHSTREGFSYQWEEMETCCLVLDVLNNILAGCHTEQQQQQRVMIDSGILVILKFLLFSQASTLTLLMHVCRFYCIMVTLGRKTNNKQQINMVVIQEDVIVRLNQMIPLYVDIRQDIAMECFQTLGQIILYGSIHQIQYMVSCHCIQSFYVFFNNRLVPPIATEENIQFIIHILQTIFNCGEELKRRHNVGYNFFIHRFEEDQGMDLMEMLIQYNTVSNLNSPTLPRNVMGNLPDILGKLQMDLVKNRNIPVDDVSRKEFMVKDIMDVQVQQQQQQHVQIQQQQQQPIPNEIHEMNEQFEILQEELVKAKLWDMTNDGDNLKVARVLV